MKVAPNKSRPWLLEQDEIWIDRSGKIRKVEDIDREYAVNLIAFLMRRYGAVFAARSPLMRRLLARSARP